MNSEAEKNPGGLNIREELEALRDHWKKIENAHRKMEESHVSDGIAMGIAECIRDLDALLHPIPEGWELRPREPSEGMIDAYHHTYLRNVANPILSPREKMACQWRAMWDAASEEKGDD